MDTMRYTSMPNARSSTATSSGYSSYATIDSSESDDDDCQILAWRNSKREDISIPEPIKFQNSVWSAWEVRSSGKEPFRESNVGRKLAAGSMDPELVEDSQYNLRRQWEAATLRRRTSAHMRSEGSKAGTYGWRSQPPDSTGPGRESDSSTTEGGEPAASGTAQSNGTPVGDFSCHDLGESTSTSTESEVQTTELKRRAQGDAEIDEVASGSREFAAHADASNDQVHASSSTPTFCGGEVPTSSMHRGKASFVMQAERDAERWYEPGEAYDIDLNQPNFRSNTTDGASTSGQHDNSIVHDNIADQINTDAEGLEIASGFTVGQELAGVREKLKETADFKLADEEEWARRQLELQKQAQEARRLRKRKRAEADRKHEVEFRQKQRLEEIRRTQQKEERNMDLKGELRGQVQGDLERLALGCRDMASLLRRLKIPVEGGLFPSSQQVNAAYKKALLRFHPDRASAYAQGDPQRQVEAEETFKLISRMRTILKPSIMSNELTAD